MQSRILSYRLLSLKLGRVGRHTFKSDSNRLQAKACCLPAVTKLGLFFQFFFFPDYGTKHKSVSILPVTLLLFQDPMRLSSNAAVVVVNKTLLRLIHSSKVPCQ